MSQIAVAIYAMIAACLLPFGCAVLAKVFGGFRPADNQHPRAFLANLNGLPARLHAAQQNSFESLPIFLASVLTAEYMVVGQTIINYLAWMYIFLRVGYVIAYAYNWATIRSMIWTVSLACPLLLFWLCVRA